VYQQMANSLRLLRFVYHGRRAILVDFNDGFGPAAAATDWPGIVSDKGDRRCARGLPRGFERPVARDVALAAAIATPIAVGVSTVTHAIYIIAPAA
jgi:hypothetical protein